MTCAVNITGTISSGGCGGCGDSELGCGGGAGIKQQSIGYGCGALYFESVKSTDCAVQVSTPGAVGQYWEDLPVTLKAYGLLSIQSTAPIALRIGAAVAELLGTPIALPINVDGLTLELELEGTALAVVFDTLGPIPLTDVAHQINAAAVRAGFQYLPASAVGSQLLIKSEHTGKSAEINAGVGRALFGLGEQAFGGGEEIKVNGATLLQFANAVSDVLISGQAQVQVFAAGTP